MDEHSQEAAGTWRDVVSVRARQIVEAEHPYDAASRMSSDLNRVMVEPSFTAHGLAGSVMVLWLELTDAVDGPSRCAQGLERSEIEQLMRRAADEWLALGADTPSVERYVQRWSSWPDLAQGRTHPG